LTPVAAGVIPQGGICSDACESPWLSRGWDAVSGALRQQNTENPTGVTNASILTLVRTVSGFLGAFMAPGFQA
jgi:hypothetical protein